MEAFNYQIERAELYRKALALKAEGMKPAEIYRELNQKIPYAAIYSWIREKYKPILG